MTAKAQSNVAVQTKLPPEYGASITLAQAKKVMEAAESEAAKRQWPLVIAIVDAAGHLLMLHRADQAQLASVEVAQLKATTAVRFRRPTKVFEDGIGAGGTRLLSLPGMVALEGGLPIMLGGKVIGGIGVSGMQSSEDAEIACAGLAALS